MKTVLHLQGLQGADEITPDTVSTNSFVFCGSSASIVLCFANDGQ